MILIDSGPLVALCDARDGKHRMAVTHLASLAGNVFGTCDAVQTKASVHLPRESQRQRLRGLLRELDVEPVPAEPDGRFWSDTFDWLDRHAEHEPDWTDACLAVLSGRDRHTKIWTYDKDFRSTWRRLNGAALPLAVSYR
jgi:predicted nucleic acid-binding protein